MNESSIIPIVDVNRRLFFKHTVKAAAGVVILGGAGVMSACGEKISFYVSTVIGSLEALSPLLPSASDLIGKAITAAKAFDKAYTEGKFADSTALFANLGDFAIQIAEMAGAASPQIKQAIAIGRIALNIIASILKSNMKDPAIAALVNARSDAAAQHQKAMIEKFADDKMIEMLFQAAKR